ncbi:helix-turn-helix domain-containing protein [Streptomyces sp. H27-D2]|uniref:helix-turn-helix domain-containing protein n=1 Tax=Streptomyces sp. H27-D2 TaxID=3046304 RepID=UPI002DB9C77E|nr:helix-turn-helix transcriptional regulator [Streptomyces sp. H27-D2]MEC4015155.1 helix-turn-helix transcriptional regulator [Streptomyces sp. H27-D2]
MAGTVRSRRLGAELRKLRDSLSLNAEAVARDMGFSRPKLSRIEAGEVRVSPNDLKALLRAYGVQDAAQQDQYLAAAREARTAGWWQAYQDALPREYADYIALEAAANVIKSSQPILVPGLLQTEAYTRAVIHANPWITPPADIESLVKIRRERQAILDREGPPRLWFIIGESAIRQLVGGPAVMREQLDRLEQLTSLQHVMIQVLPHGAGAHAGLNGPFVIFGFSAERGPDIVCLENLTGTLYMDQPGELEGYGTAFDHLRASALNPADSLALIQQVAKEL